MADILDIAAVDPDLELTLRPTSLQCSGTLSSRTLSYVLDAAETLLAAQPPVLVIDMSRVYVADVDGANTFVRLQRMAQGAGVQLRWIGLEPDRLGGLHPLRSPSQRAQAPAGPVRIERSFENLHRRRATLPPIA